MCALTNVVFTDFNLRDDRSILRSDSDIHSVSTFGSSLFHNKIIGSSRFNRVCSVGDFVSTTNRGGQIILEPLIGEVFQIVVVNMTGEVGHTTVTNCRIINRDGGNRSSFDINIVRLAHNRTAGTKVYLDGIAIGFSLCIARSVGIFAIIECGSKRGLCHQSRCIVQIPCLLHTVKHEAVIPTYTCNEADDIAFATHLVARNNNHRERTYRNHCRGGTC